MVRTDYKDDIFDGNRKYQMIKNNDGTYSLVDVTEYIQEADIFNAAEINSWGTIVNGVRSDMDILIAKSNALDDKTTTFCSDGSIIETMSGYVKTITFPRDGSVLETLTYLDGQTKTKKTTFVGNEIKEEVVD